MRTQTIVAVGIVLAGLGVSRLAQAIPGALPAPEAAPEPAPAPAADPAPPGDPVLVGDPAPDASASGSASASASADVNMSVSADSDGAPAAGKKLSAITVALKFGGLFPQPFAELGTSYLVTLEGGYWFAMKRRLGVTLELGYTAPTASGSESDARVPGGSYDWDLQQRELILGASVLYRLPMGKLTVYGGIGPRLFMLDSHVDGSAGGQAIKESTEQSTKFGFGVPIGAGFRLGPGDLVGELLMAFSSLDHKVTGDANTGALSFSLGYRLGF